MAHEEDEVSQAERRAVMTDEARRRAGDLEKYVPALGDGRQPPELSAERKQQVQRELAAAEAKARASTYLGHTHSDIGGRFSVTQNESITGLPSNRPPPLPASSPWHGQHVDQDLGENSGQGMENLRARNQGGAPSALPADVAAPLFSSKQSKRER